MRKTLVAVTLFALLAAPRVALACPVCFGQNDSAMAKAINWGILAMIAFIGVVLACFATFMIHLARRARQVNGALTAGHASNPQEGTAQC